MAISLESLYESIKAFNLKLCAGSGGMKRCAGWYHTVESLEISEFLTGGELVFTTGVAIKSNAELCNLVRSIYAHGACAVVINLGPYIESIPRELEDFCNKEDFPLFIVPWHVHMADIMRRISLIIAESESGDEELSKALEQAILHHHDEDAYVPKLAQMGLGENGGFAVGISDIPATQLPDASEGCRMVSLVIEHRQVAVFYGLCPGELHEYCKKAEDKGGVLYIGRVVRTVRDLYKSYSDAVSLAAYRRAIGSEGKCLVFEEMGLFSLLLSVDADILESYKRRTLGALRAYDAENRCDCLGAVKAYIASNSSIQGAAEQLGIHKNTLLYRLHKAEEALGGNISDLELKSALLLALMAEKMEESVRR